MQPQLKDAKLFVTDNQMVYALFDYHKVNSEQNVYSFTLNGHLVWQIEPMDKIHALNYYTSIYFTGTDLFAYCINGVEVKLNKETGKILTKELIK